MKVHSYMIWGPYYLQDRDGGNYILYYQLIPFAEPRKAEIFISINECRKNNILIRKGIFVDKDAVHKLVMEKVKEIVT